MPIVRVLLRGVSTSLDTNGVGVLCGCAMMKAKGMAMRGIGEEVGQLLDKLGLDRARWTDGSMPSVTPLTGEQLGMVQVVDGAAIDAQLDAASAAFRAWRHAPAPQIRRATVQTSVTKSPLVVRLLLENK